MNEILPLPPKESLPYWHRWVLVYTEVKTGLFSIWFRFGAGWGRGQGADKDRLDF